jgi:starvation-inducible DNA-binding protein
MKTTKTYEPLNGVSLQARNVLCQLLNGCLATAVDLRSQVKQAHWNVKGPNYIALHELFRQVADGVENHTDLLAERIVQLGGIALGTVRVAASGSRLEEYPLSLCDEREHILSVARALVSWAEDLRAAILESTERNDYGSADMLTVILRGIEMWIWFVEALGQAPKKTDVLIEDRQDSLSSFVA